MNRRQRELQFAELAEESFKDHVILVHHKEPYLRYLVGNPNGSSVYKAEVLLTCDNCVIVHGDVDLVCFHRYSGVPDGAIGWIARSNIDYLTTKVSRGTGVEVAECWDSAVALDDALQYTEDGSEYRDVYDPDPDDADPELISWKAGWEKIAEGIVNGASEQEIAECIYNMTHDSDYCGIGICPSPRVIWAYHLVKKLHALLEK